jgi:RNA polymerase sigma-70 factor (ECF subfamily)
MYTLAKGLGNSPSAASAVSPAPEPDHELLALVRRARLGEAAAQAELIRRYRVRVAGFLRPRVPHSHEVEDLLQAVWIKMVRRIRGLREPERFETWLFTLARNSALDHLRRARCRPVGTADEATLVSLPDDRQPARHREILEALEVALRQFGPRERRVVRQLIDGESYGAIAAREGVSLNALKVRIHRLRLVLRVSVRAAHEGVPAVPGSPAA